MRHDATRLTASLLLFVGFCAPLLCGQEQPKPRAKRTSQTARPLQPIEDQAGLPRVLLIGDSISIGYTLPVRELLKGRANVHRPATNCGPTTRGLELLESWLGEKRWDVIHFNWGLHDLKYMGPEGQNLADPAATDSHPQVPLDEYEANLRRLVKRLKATKAKLIWCSTTPVPAGAQGRVVGDSAKYNQTAARVMQENQVAMNDLYSFAKPRLAEIQRPANVHFTPDGSQRLAEQVAEAILEALQR
jgi:acyl-CoA thioesterase-1